MPFGIPASCHKTPVAASDEIYDVTFVGQKHGIRELMLSQLRGAGIQVHTWGHFWPDHKDHHGRPTVPEMVDVFNRSKINLNLRWCSRSPNYGQIKGRDFELMGCGAFMMATKHFETEDFNELYTPGEEFAEADMAHMADTIRHYLGDDTIRTQMAERAYQKRDQHLWTTRLKTFLEDWGTW